MSFLLCDPRAGTGAQGKHFSKLERRAINLNGFFFQKASECLNSIFFPAWPPPPIATSLEKNKKQQELSLENKDNDLEEKKKWGQPGFALLPSPPALQGEGRESSGWTGVSDPDRVSVPHPHTEPLPLNSGGGHMNDLRQNSCILFPSGWPRSGVRARAAEAPF